MSTTARTATGTLERTTFCTSRTLDYFTRKELIAQTGHDPDDWPLVIVKELVDNGLDACEDANTPPEIAVAVDASGITVSDNGPGIPADVVEGILDYTVRVSSKESYVSPCRGAQGNALKTIVAMPFVLDDGDSGRVDITACGIRHEITLRVDRIRQEPVIDHERHPDDAQKVKSGSSVRVHWPGSSFAQPWRTPACDFYRSPSTTAS